jgi:hypothetical protein
VIAAITDPGEATADARGAAEIARCPHPIAKEKSPGRRGPEGEEGVSTRR